MIGGNMVVSEKIIKQLKLIFFKKRIIHLDNIYDILLEKLGYKQHG